MASQPLYVWGKIVIAMMLTYLCLTFFLIGAILLMLDTFGKYRMQAWVFIAIGYVLFIAYAVVLFVR